MQTSGATTIFALDIGTRSVVGIVAQTSTGGMEILAAESMEHENRAMLDGQIHDIQQVADTVKTIKEKLESQVGHPLTHVAVAAAGRALRTVRTYVSEDIALIDEVRQDDILRLELQGVQKAQQVLVEEESLDHDLNYHCVGYSIVRFQLDGYQIGSLLGQKGRSMSVEVLATFLPRVVVDSLFAVLNRAELEMMSLTLEPIAASTVVIPSNMRQLNIALVDVGAGTSDVAISADGSIMGYAMVPMAGDEITETLCSEYLLDFNEGERVKRLLTEGGVIEFEDILGYCHKVPSQVIIENIEETVNNLAMQIAEKIVNLNQKPPQAVICIGGGALTPLLPEKIADHLGLTHQRVGIRGREIISAVSGATKLLGPEAVTPIGIATAAYSHQGLGFAKVNVNNQQVRLFEVRDITVADALLAAGINMKKMQSRLGMAITATVNGELKIIRGASGEPAVIRVNDTDAHLDSPVQHNDVILVKEAVDGENAVGRVQDVIPNLKPITVQILGEEIFVEPIIIMDDKAVDIDTDLTDGAHISYHMPRVLGAVLTYAGWEDISEGYKFFVNGNRVGLSEPVRDGDVISFEELQEGEDEVCEPPISQEWPEHAWADPGLNGHQEEAGVRERSFEDAGLLEDTVFAETSDVGEDDALLLSTAEVEGVEENEVLAAEESLEGHFSVRYHWDEDEEKNELGNVTPLYSTQLYVNDEVLVIPRTDLIFTDILAHIDFATSPPSQGAKLIMQVNGLPSEFTTPLRNGDRVRIYWHVDQLNVGG